MDAISEIGGIAGIGPADPVLTNPSGRIVSIACLG